MKILSLRKLLEHIFQFVTHIHHHHYRRHVYGPYSNNLFPVDQFVFSLLFQCILVHMKLQFPCRLIVQTINHYPLAIIPMFYNYLI
jgi:hypothetical protein